MDELGLKPFATPVRNAKKNEDCDGQQNFAAPLISGNMDAYKKYKLLKKHLNFLKNWLASSLEGNAFSRWKDFSSENSIYVIWAAIMSFFVEN